MNEKLLYSRSPKTNLLDYKNPKNTLLLKDKIQSNLRDFNHEKINSKSKDKQYREDQNSIKTKIYHEYPNNTDNNVKYQEEQLFNKDTTLKGGKLLNVQNGITENKAEKNSKSPPSFSDKIRQVENQKYILSSKFPEVINKNFSNLSDFKINEKNKDMMLLRNSLNENMNTEKNILNHYWGGRSDLSFNQVKLTSELLEKELIKTKNEVIFRSYQNLII